MEKTSNLLKPTLLMALAAAAGTAGAAPATQVGTPDAKPAIVDTIGLDVDAGAALKSIVPDTWGVLVHKNSVLPPKLSWNDGKDWVTTLTKVLEPHKMHVKVDWTKKTVFVKKQVETVAVLPNLDDAPAQAEAPAAPVAPVELKVVFAKGERLSHSLDKLFKQVGYTGKYQLEGSDLESEEEAVVVGTTLTDVLNQALPPIGLTAEIFTPSKIVVIKFRDEVAQ